MNPKPENVELKPISRDSDDLPLLEAINTEAIPENERNALTDLFDSNFAGNLEIIGIYADGKPAGFFALRSFRTTRYLAYFAVHRALRGKGIGSKAIQMLLRRCAGCQTIVEYEAPELSGDIQDIRHRRKRFYARNGFRQTGWYNLL